MLNLTQVLNTIGAEQSEYPFRPVKCLEKDLENKSPINGFVYFTTDTHKIFCGHNNEYIPMGGTSGIYYGQKQLTDEEKYGNDVLFTFYPEEIDSDDVPVKDDLILNIPDGGFYRVLESTNLEISVQRLMIAGTGTGGPSTAQGSLTINYKSPSIDSTLAGQDYFIAYEIEAKDSAGDVVRNEGTAIYKVGGQEVGREKVKNGYHEFNVGPYLDYTVEYNNVTVTVTMDTGGSVASVQSKKWEITAINLALEWPWTYSFDEYRKNDTFTFTVKPFGNTECTLHIVFDNDYTLGETYFTETISKSEANGEDYNTQAMKSLPYGVHTCEMYLTSDSAPEPTPTIKREITFTKDGTGALLTVPFYETEVTQYQTVNIPFLVYDPDNADNCSVSFYVNDVKISTDTYDRSLHSWPYTPTDVGPVRLKIATDDGDDSKEIVLTVEELALNVSETQGYAFSIKANNFSSNEELRQWRPSGKELLTFSDNFDWKRGGLKFNTLPNGDIEKYIVVRQGTRMTINYPLFKNFTTGANGGKEFKFCFKTANCYDYEAPVLQCHANGIGIKVNAQETIFEAGAVRGFNAQYRENAYIELETEIWPDVADTNDNLPGSRFMMFWVDGVPSGARIYSHGQSFEQTTEQNIVIGSDLCDVYIYTIKAYERKLSTTEHINNFIMDAPSASEMMDRYIRNDILTTTGEISYEKLVQANPECRAYVYEIPQMTKNKDDKVKNCKYYELWRDNNTLDNPYYKSDNATIYVQGTSSAAYGVAAFNLRSKFSNLQDKDGNIVEGWQVTEDAIPIEIACSKVNVASCENVNNVVNQEWYNRFQPYHDAHRRKAAIDGKAYRDTMQFESGVLFIKDNNKITEYYNNENKPSATEYLNANVFFDTTLPDKRNYTANPYYKQYAICNMGNDKKNVNVFHDLDGGPLVSCVEITNNNNPEQWMTTSITDENWTMEEPYHEFRYPDGNDKADSARKQAWMDFVAWMVESNPRGGNDEYILKAYKKTLTAATYKKNCYFVKNEDGKYIKAINDFDNNETYYEIKGGVQVEGDELIEVLFDNYTYKGFDPPGYEGTENPTGVSLKGTVETAFSTTQIIKYPKRDDNGNIMMDNDGNVIMDAETVITPYTHDTYEYRMAKMLSECEDHLVMDSVVYHYLFIQRHTMVDNVAKNTFWSTEDGVHWDLTKDYDNDTSDGNDNSGYLTFTYGLECLDKIDGKDTFNGPNSVWIQFIHGLAEAQKNLYRALQNKGAWNAAAYLAECKRHQNKIPERCWIEDYLRKYIRPYRLGLDGKEGNKFLEKLDGGKKTHQRDAYETYQEFYINSKYITGNDFNPSAAIDMRLNKLDDVKWDTNYVMPVKFYVDCYGSLELAGRTIQSQRLKRGDVWNIPVGSSIGDPVDATCYIYGARMIQSLNNLHKVYPSYVGLAGANKLRELSVGSNEANYYNSKLGSLSVNNSMLQKLQAQNCGIQTGIGTLDLTNATQLSELLIGGSTFNAISLADGCLINKLELNAPTELTLSNLSYLSEENLTIDPKVYNTIENVYIQNCPAFNNYTYNIARTSTDTLTRYLLTDVEWVIDGLAPGYSLTDDFVLNEDNNVIGIKALDNLNDENTKAKIGYTAGTALTGNLTIDVNCSISEYDIYKKYISTFPNLIIKYTEKVEGRIPATELIFYTNSEVNAQHYRVLGMNEYVSTLISQDGPLGVAMAIPHKEDSTSMTYTFTGYWINKNNPNEKYYDSNTYDIEKYGSVVEGAIDFATFIPEEKMEFYPDYKDAPRQYLVRFYDWDNTLILQDSIEAWPVDYNTIYNGPIREYQYRDSADLNSNQRYSFVGWSKRRYKDLVDNIPDGDRVYLNELRVTNNINLYACYKAEDVYTNPTSYQYFNISDGKISLKPEYKNILAGKITLPENDEHGNKITVFGDFAQSEKITHIFFENPYSCAYATVDNKACEKSKELIYVDLPTSISKIGSRAFAECLKLTSVNLDANDNITSIESEAFYGIGSAPEQQMQITITKLPAALTKLGGRAFCYGGPNITIKELPKGLTELEGYVFGWCPYIAIQEFGSNDNSSMLGSIKQYALCNCGYGKQWDNAKFHFYSSVKKIDAGVFNESSFGEKAEAIFYHTESADKAVLYETYTGSPTYSSPDGSGSVPEGKTLGSMGWGNRAFGYYDYVNGIYYTGGID